MNKRNLFVSMVLLVCVLSSACAPQAAVTPTATSAPAEPITLRLAVSDHEGRPSEPYVLEFVEQVKTLSKGDITIEPTWDAAADITPAFEQGVVKIVKEGQYDLGLAGSRAWDSLGVTKFEALQAPFLITNDALAEAVASSAIAKRMLDGLSSVEVVGLALWPEDLRHPFSVIPDKPILAPQDFAGLNVRAVPSEVTYLLIETLGGTPMFGDNYQAVESGLRQGASLSGTPTATGNVIFFPKFQVLFANGTAFEKLSEAQRSILREAATATQQKALAEHPSDVDAGAAWCADGGSIVLASPEQVAAFQTAAQPVFDKLQKDAFNAEAIAAIRELKTQTKASSGAQACASTVVVPTQVSAENQTWSPGLPPNGIWTVDLSVDDFVRMGVSRSKAEKEWAGTYTLTFQDGKYKFDYQGTSGVAFGCEADMVLQNDVVQATYTNGVNCKTGVDYIQWRLDADGLHLHLVSIKNAPYIENKAFYEAKPWQKVEVWSPGLPPNGVWQVELTSDDFLRMGVNRAAAADWVGTYTTKYQNGRSIEDFKGPARTTHCEADLEVVGDVVRETYTSSVPRNVCLDPVVVFEFQWRLDNDGLHLHLVSIKEAPFLENAAVLEAKPWQKIP